MISKLILKPVANKWLILFCVFFVFVSACRNKFYKIDKLGTECSAGNQKACDKLVDIARNKAMDNDIRRMAVLNLTDQTVLASFADDPEVDACAVSKLTDPKVLAGIVWGHEVFDIIGRVAIEKIAAQASLAEITADEKDMKLRLILKLIAVCESLPKDRKTDLMILIFPAIRFLNDPAIVPLFGEIVSIETFWNKTSRQYVGDVSGNMPGEAFSCRIKVQKLLEPLSYTWETVFPLLTSSLAFSPANVTYADLLTSLFEKIGDQSLLANIAENHKDSEVREAAIGKLTDRNVLAYIAEKDHDERMRSVAKKRIEELSKN
jgi:hypothetical protein